jgi:hypothetical protein
MATTTTKEQACKSARQRLIEVEDRIEKLKFTRKDHPSLSEHLKNIEAQRANLATTVSEMEGAGEAAWQGVQVKVDKAFDSFNHSLSKALD